MKHKLIIALLLATITISFTSCAQTKYVRTTATAHNPVDLSTINERILTLINQHRKSIGKGDLKMIDVASAQALQHSKDMMNGRTPFGHDGFKGRADAVKNTIGFINAAAENVAYGQMSAEEVVDGWLHSPGHKANIEGNYNLTGIGVAQSRDGVLYFTQLFVLKK